MADDQEDISKKCAETGTTLKRSRRYYRNGKYFINKNAFRTFEAKLKEQAKEEKESAS